LSFETERQLLETRFNDNWSLTPIKWPNVTLTTYGLDEWVAMHILRDPADQALIGNVQHLYRYPGVLAFQVFTVPNTGSRRAKELSTAISDIWRTKPFSGITVLQPIETDLGIVDGWYQLDIVFPYYRNEYRAVSGI